MKINTLKDRPEITDDLKLNETYTRLKKYLYELDKRELPDDIAVSINNDIEELNMIWDSGKEFRKKLSKKQSKIISFIEKKMKLAPKNYYKKLWTGLGICVFGVPFGFTFGWLQGNMIFWGAGIALGLSIGIAVGSGMDKKANEEGRQLDVEMI